MRSRPALDRVLLEISSPVKESVKYENGAELFLDTWKDREEKAEPIAKVYSVGLLSKLGLQEGDTVCISYKVMSGYDISEGGVTTYRNKYRIDDGYRWLAQNEDIHAVWRDGKWEPVGDWVMMWPKKWTETILGVDTERTVADRGICTTTGEELAFDPMFRSEYMVPGGDGYGMGEPYLLMPKRTIRENVTRPGAWQYEWKPPADRGGKGVFIEPVKDATTGGLILPEMATTGRIGRVVRRGWSVSTVTVGDTVQWKGGADYEGMVLCTEGDIVCVINE